MKPNKMPEINMESIFRNCHPFNKDFQGTVIRCAGTIEQACRGKKKYESETDAKFGIPAGENMHAYHCGYCRKWHIGHSSER